MEINTMSESEFWDSQKALCEKPKEILLEGANVF